nr:MAG TPA: repressor [Caudoviricetes sp.]
MRGVPYLKPLNPQYRLLSWDENTRIIGVVKQKIKTY